MASKTNKVSARTANPTVEVSCCLTTTPGPGTTILLTPTPTFLQTIGHTGQTIPPSTESSISSVVAPVSGPSLLSSLPIPPSLASLPSTLPSGVNYLSASGSSPSSASPSFSNFTPVSFGMLSTQTAGPLGSVGRGGATMTGTPSSVLEPVFSPVQFQSMLPPSVPFSSHGQTPQAGEKLNQPRSGEVSKPAFSLATIQWPLLGLSTHPPSVQAYSSSLMSAQLAPEAGKSNRSGDSTRPISLPAHLEVLMHTKPTLSEITENCEVKMHVDFCMAGPE
ncbi:unnamed protein product [Protopolystoma xenopodis]|uniref:Uncharacterized protein n=1 Tax=Protopolystoma xenopodis TaxID=117903 RepID=A0A448WV57_9PLAT|nr:unnamed protein product [Protopolystoma xenopodis]